ncbi:MAG: hypothetical protein IJS14_13135 [Lentisphaeria bacterium]|nr:hypothetical protein [Lentisphaeria bacterium]
MNADIIFNETAGLGRTVSLFGLCAPVSATFSFPAPRLDLGTFFSVSPRTQSSWRIVRERMVGFFVSITGLIDGAREVLRRTVRLCRCKGSFRRQMVLRLSFAGRRL